jgi:phasin
MPQHPFEVPAELRTLAEKSVDEARKAFEGFMEAAQAARTNFEGTTSKLQAGTKDAGSKAASFAEENIRAAFSHAEKLVRAKDAEEMLALQLEFARTQMAQFQGQMKELGATIQSVVKPQ